jgi:hypothetical protein
MIGKNFEARSTQLFGLAAALLAAMWYRRPDQFTHSYIWVEDGTRNLPDFYANGWGFVVQPIVGYISLPIRLLFGISASLSFRWLPEIAFVLTLLFTYLVIVAVALSPTALRHRFLCAIALLVLPTNSEVYAVSLYTGWWGSVLALLPLLWPARSEGQAWLRAALLTIGGLSTPLCVGLLPLYGARFALWRQRTDGWILALCSALSAVQLTVMWLMAASLGASASGNPLVNVPLKFFGYYVLWVGRRQERPLYLLLGVCVIAVLAAASIVRRRTVDWTFVALTGSLVVTIALAAVRAPLDVMHPVLAGGRYFFLPYMLLSWLLLYLIDTRHQGTSVFCAALLVAALAGFGFHARWRHAPIDWRAHIERCLAEPAHQFPVHYEGTQAHGIIWAVDLSGDACRHLVAGSLFDNQLVPAGRLAPAGR